MLKLKKVAITGGVASGKSTVCQLFQKLGACVVSADAIVHELLDPQTDLGQQIIRTLGSDILNGGKIDRRLVAKKVFQNPNLLLQLEKILHPAVLRRIKSEYEKARQSGNFTSFVVEIPLLFEIGAETFYDTVIHVYTDAAIAKKRFQALGYTEQEYNLRMNRQISPESKSKLAQFTIKNNGTLEDLDQEVEKLNAIIGASFHES